MKFIELFAGIGGFRYGLENVTASEGEQSRLSKEGSILSSNKHIKLGTQQFTCVYANEWGVEAQREFWLAEGKDPTKFIPSYAQRIYRRHYGEIDTRDIRDVSEFPDHDLLTAGFPCQAFSVAGKRLGFEDIRGTLFFEIARILKSKRPRHFLLENVKGLLSHEQGQTFNTILGILSDLGYRVEWMVLNSKHFGVPQNRERVFIIGHLRGECSGEVFPIREGIEGIDERTVKTRAVRTLQGGGHSGGHHSGMTLIVQRPHGYNKGNVLDMPCLRGSSFEHNDFLLQDTGIRRLTPVECERLQGFPDGWTERGRTKEGLPISISDSQRYKCLGNAVTTTVITAIGTALLNHYRTDTKQE